MLRNWTLKTDENRTIYIDESGQTPVTLTPQSQNVGGWEEGPARFIRMARAGIWLVCWSGHSMIDGVEIYRHFELAVTVQFSAHFARLVSVAPGR